MLSFSDTHHSQPSELGLRVDGVSEDAGGRVGGYVGVTSTRRMGAIALSALMAAMAALVVACSTSVSPGDALLPEGIEDARVPDLEAKGYVFATTNPPLAVTTELFGHDFENGGLFTVPPTVELERATIVVGDDPSQFTTTLGFASEGDANAVWQRFAQGSRDDGTRWGKLEFPRLHLVRGSGAWVDSAKAALESGNTLSLRDWNLQAWNLLTNLPENPPSRPISVGMLTLDGGLFEALGENAGIDLDGVDLAFSFLRANTLGFGVYGESPIEVPQQIDREFLADSGTSAVFVSRSSYPGLLVSFILRTVAGRSGLESVELGDLNVYHRTVSDLHLVLKNSGSLIFAAVSGSRSDAEELLLSAIDR